MVAVISGMIAVLGSVSCSRLGQTNDQVQVARAFESWKSAMINNQTDQAMAYIPRHVNDYLSALNSGAGNSARAANAIAIAITRSSCVPARAPVPPS